MGLYPPEVTRLCFDASGQHDGEQAECRGTAASFRCGCVVTFDLEVTPEQLVSRLGARSNGCGFMVASARLLASVFEGRVLSDLAGLRIENLRELVCKRLGYIPPDRLHCVDISIQGLHAVFANYRMRRIDEFRGEQALICTCFGVSEQTIDKVLSDDAVATVAEVGRICRAGSGCGSCRMIIQEMLDAHESGHT